MQVNTQNRCQTGPRDIEAQVKKMANRAILKIAGRGLRAYSVLKHVGRRSGREYLTPVTAYPLGDGFVFALLYGDGANVDWCRNVMAAGTCTLRTLGREITLEKPEMITASQALGAYPLPWRLMIRARGINQFLWLHRQPENLWRES